MLLFLLVFLFFFILTIFAKQSATHHERKQSKFAIYWSVMPIKKMIKSRSMCLCLQWSYFWCKTTAAESANKTLKQQCLSTRPSTSVAETHSASSQSVSVSVCVTTVSGAALRHTVIDGLSASDSSLVLNLCSLHEHCEDRWQPRQAHSLPHQRTTFQSCTSPPLAVIPFSLAEMCPKLK